MQEKPPTTDRAPTVGLLVTCLVDLFRPSVGFAAIKLLEDAGVRVEVPLAQTCCGQPAYNSGDREDAKAIARDVVALFEPFDYCVVPSGSCAGMLKLHYPKLLADDAEFAERAAALSEKTYELTSFLADVRGAEMGEARLAAKAGYHDSCSSLRELGIRAAPRRLLGQVKGLDLVELAEPQVCCGFGGSFAVKYPGISGAMVDAKTADIKASGARCIISADLGCLMNIAGRLTREGSAVACWHVAEVLAGMTDGAPIGQDGQAG